LIDGRSYRRAKSRCRRASRRDSTAAGDLTNLYAVRDSGLLRKTIKIAGIENEYEYRSDKELLAAINALERRLGMNQLTNIVVHGRKGWNRRNHRGW
jgi:hypothetical protein